MRITGPGDIDLDVRVGTRASEVLAVAGLERGWCGPVALDPDHPAGIPPLVHGARLTASPAPSCVPPAGPRLRVAEGPDAGHTIALDRAVIVGRGDGADLRLDDPAVSAAHALVTGPGRVRVRDLRSANGTGSPRLRRLRPGDHVTVGRSRIVFEDPGVDPSAPASTSQRTSLSGDASRRWAMLAGGLASGVALAAMTGRWQLALVGIVPAAAPWLGQLLARRRDRHPHAVPRSSGVIAVRGEREAARAYVRALLIERGRRLAAGDWEEPWMRWLDPPHPDDRVVTLPAGDPWPSWSEMRVDVTREGRIEDDGRGPRALLPLAVSEATADLAARRRASTLTDESLPRELRWGDIAHAVDSDAPLAGPRRLRAALGAAAHGPFVLDLDADGPHVLVAGTTGSGKSVALETLVAALAHAHAPSDLTLALVDFKGGAGLRACMALPHVAATLTDLDGALARRALAGLSHELAARKEALRARGLASLAQWEAVGGAPPRLLVVIDEYQEIVSSHSSFLPDLARIAAQGRSLGLHLVLATQRPAGAVTPEVRANVATTIALRVASSSESRDLLGTSDAAAIPATLPGRAIVARGTEHSEVQIAAPGADPSPGAARALDPRPPGAPLAHAAAARWAGHRQAAPLWLPPLPDRWEPAADQGGVIALALLDRPAQRAQPVATWDPRAGTAVVIGAPQSGRTSMLRSLATQARLTGLTPVFLPPDPRLASRTLALACELPHVLLLIDDVDGALTRLATVDDGAPVEDLARRAALRLPTAMAGGPGTPLRLGAGAAVLAVHGGVEPSLAAQWGVPRSLVEHGGSPARGRAHVRTSGSWDLGQLAASTVEVTEALVTPLPVELSPARAGAALGIGGDDARAIPVPAGPVTLVGARGRTRDAAQHRLTGVEVTTVDLPALVPAGAGTVVLTEPSARAVRQLSPHGWRGVTDPHPVPGRVVLISDGAATAVQLPLP
ncbi:MAG: FtsK/SpoIIIE domain-containing protein [Demequina sp.]